MVKEKAYAKINVALEVMEKKDGYHKVNNIMIPIDLYDDLSFSKDDSVYVDRDTIENNICVKAANLFLEKYNIKQGVCIKLRKRIPIMAGLAGGSSDAAATLRGLNRLFKVNASTSELKELAAMLGSDVPFFIETKAALCTNRGEVIEPFDFSMPKFKILLIKPNSFGLSTKEVYEAYEFNGESKADKIEQIIHALRNKNVIELKENIFNDLEAVALKLSPNLSKVFEKIKEKSQVYVSGSGPTMVVINPTKEEILNASLIGDMYIRLCHTK